jgi:hypothetical protein
VERNYTPRSKNFICLSSKHHLKIPRFLQSKRDGKTKDIKRVLTLNRFFIPGYLFLQNCTHAYTRAEFPWLFCHVCKVKFCFKFGWAYLPWELPGNLPNEFWRHLLNLSCSLFDLGNLFACLRRARIGNIKFVTRYFR